jgi:hypothetical protein
MAAKDITSEELLYRLDEAVALRESELADLKLVRGAVVNDPKRVEALWRIFRRYSIGMF